MAYTDRFWQDAAQTKAQVRVCDSPNDCVVIGQIRLNPLKNEWSIEPATGPATSTKYLTQGEAELALVDIEREAWCREAKLAQRTLSLLEEV
jgi:hypothetical protein